MVIDIPANFIEQVKNIDWSGVREAVKDYGPVLTVLRDTWDRETLAQIADGHLFVRDATLNEAIAKNIGTEGTVRGIELHSHADGRLDLICTTSKKYKKIELSGTIEEFVHDGDKSYAVYRVRKKNIPDHGFVSWVFSRVSLSLAERMMGRFDVSDTLPVEIRGNKVYVDFHEVLAASKLGQTTFQGHKLTDMIEIEGASVQEGGIMFDTKLNVPDDVKNALRAIVRERGSAAAGDGAEEGGEH
ncbi:hypothetical protein [Selenomonas sp. oral taxon 138]|uniref:hypothetical protein n=1 Tax=Selenomonas sp. oral taxon 138 TaxID=712532 RepID=UPI0002A2B0E1|nr:hypothetical protein [Selenomonas sp. oral taxon 138]EKX96612.1 hypothetical protein HMPREF9163_01617 [Selenomonas sp. oral taxon 138 str. F0429]